jgi:ParB family chromosome partitioning protein
MNEKKTKGLGRGLMSLFGDQNEVSAVNLDTNKKMTSSNNLIPISDLVPNKFQPRITFDKDKITELSMSIKHNGLIQPIAVRKILDQDGKFEIIAGERRWLAAQEAGLHEVPVVILNLDDNQSLEVAIVENIQRENLNSIEEAKAYQKLMKEFNYNHDKLSRFMGKSKSHISNTLRLLSLPDSVLKLVEVGELTAGQVRPLIGRFNALEIAKTIVKENLSSRSVESLIQRTDRTINPRIDSNLLAIEKQIENKLGLKVNIFNKKNNSGKITIEYKNLDQLELVTKLLKSKK